MPAVYLKFIIHQVNIGEAHLQFPLLYPAFIRGRALSRGNTVLLLYLFLNFVFFCLFVCLFVRSFFGCFFNRFLSFFHLVCDNLPCSGMFRNVFRNVPCSGFC